MCVSACQCHCQPAKNDNLHDCHFSNDLSSIVSLALKNTIFCLFVFISTGLLLLL